MKRCEERHTNTVPPDPTMMSQKGDSISEDGLPGETCRLIRKVLKVEKCHTLISSLIICPTCNIFTYQQYMISHF